MQRVFANPTEIEKIAKKTYGIPDFLMMENAAASMSDFILSSWNKQNTSQPKVLIVCGKGNNGGDGYALARKLQGKADIQVYCFEEPAQSVSEAYVQFEMCRKLGICFLQKEQLFAEIEAFDFIVDCLYGTGFHGELKPEAAELIKHLNQNASSHCFKIACDIPSAFFFKADYTISMGTQKLCFYSDEAKQACGKIIVANLGLERNKFEQTTEASSPMCLIEKDDIKLPLRKNAAAHKGTYGHTAVFAGEKSGAAIIAATAAINFGSGLTTLVKTNNSNLEQFKISPELMISDSIPAKTTGIVFGSGFDSFPQNDFARFMDWFESKEKPAAVFDAGILNAPEFINQLTEMNKKQDAQIVLTPHLLEFSRFCKNLILKEVDFSIEALSKSPETKIKLGKMITSLFPNTTLVVKSANTFIFTAHACDHKISGTTTSCETYIIADGAQSLAKGGSGDVLAGMIGALLAQGYNAKEAAVTACEVHALAAASYGKESFDLTPEKLIEKIISL
jgi:hydroxyethylthiazole kinase-like uncharacterized protein yjeF